MTFNPNTAALGIALGYEQAGTYEVGGNNRGDQVEFFQRVVRISPGDPWCDAFVNTSWLKGWAAQGGKVLTREGLLAAREEFEQKIIKLSGSCADTWHYAKLRNYAISKAETPKIGDAVLFDFLGQGTPHHIGFVRGVSRDYILTIEGNTSAGSSGSQTNGDGVYARARPHDHIFGYIRLR